MKRNYILLSIILLFSIGLVLGVVYLNNPLIFSKTTDTTLNTNISMVRYPVHSGKIQHTYDVKGQVVCNNPDVYLEKINVEGVTDYNFKMLKSVGDDVDAGTPFYELEYDSYIVDYPSRIVDVCYEQTEETTVAVITLLNYDKLYIEANIKSNKIDSIKHDTKVILTINGEEYPSSIKSIGYEISDDMLPVQIEMPKNYLPGTKAEITFVLDTVDAGMFVSEEAIFQNGEKFYANVEDGDSVKQVEVKIGQRFQTEEEGNIFKYVEILSGITEDNILVVETIDDNGSEIKENLNHE